MSRNPILSPATIGGVILAGGRSRRMGGGDKCLAPLDGRPLLAHAIDRLAPQVGPLVLNANGDPARFAAFGLPVIADGFPGFAGPLAGVLAGLDWAAGSGLAAVVTVPADTPFFPEDMVARLAAAMARADAPAAVARPIDAERGPVAAPRLRPVVGRPARRPARRPRRRNPPRPRLRPRARRRRGDLSAATTAPSSTSTPPTTCAARRRCSRRAPGEGLRRHRLEERRQDHAGRTPRRRDHRRAASPSPRSSTRTTPSTSTSPARTATATARPARARSSSPPARAGR